MVLQAILGPAVELSTVTHFRHVDLSVWTFPEVGVALKPRIARELSVPVMPEIQMLPSLSEKIK